MDKFYYKLKDGFEVGIDRALGSGNLVIMVKNEFGTSITKEIYEIDPRAVGRQVGLVKQEIIKTDYSRYHSRILADNAKHMLATTTKRIMYDK